MTLSKSDFPYIKTDKSLSINHKGVTRIIPSDDARYAKISLCIKNGDWDSIPTLMDPASQVVVYSNGRMKVENGQVSIGGKQVPTRLNARILALMEAKEPFEVLVNFFERLQKNPSNRSVNQLFDFLEANHFPLHPDGRFLAYKGVASDYKDLHSHTFDNSPGKIVKMERNEVDEDPFQTCSNGLHVASYSYAHGFSNGQKVVEVLVDPKDVVAVPKDHNDAKMRVCEYLVLGDSKGERPKTEQVVHDDHQCFTDDCGDVECMECGEDVDGEDICDECDVCVNCCDCDE